MFFANVVQEKQKTKSQVEEQQHSNTLPNRHTRTQTNIKQRHTYFYIVQKLDFQLQTKNENPV